MYSGEGEEQRVRSHTPHFTPAVSNLSNDFTLSACSHYDFYISPLKFDFKNTDKENMHHFVFIFNINVTSLCENVFLCISNFYKNIC